MVQITERTRYIYDVHGWSSDDIAYLAENADNIEQENDWAMGVATGPDGVKWLFPASEGDIFPVSLWKRIKWYLENNENVVMPMTKNFDKVSAAASRYNGYLNDNMYMFGEQMKNIDLEEKYKGHKRRRSVEVEPQKDLKLQYQGSKRKWLEQSKD